MYSFLEAILRNLPLLLAPLVLTYLYYKWTYQYWKRRNIPYIEPKIPFGSVRNPLTVSIRDETAEIYKEAKRRGWKYCGFYATLTPIFLVLDLDLVKNVLTKDFQYFVDRGTYTNEKDPLGAHLFGLEGQKWKNLRAKLTPTFTSGKLKSMFQTLVDCGLILEDYIEANIKPNDAVDIKDLLASFSTDVIGSCAFGLECNSFKNPDSLFRYYGRNIFTPTPKKVIKFLLTETFPNFSRRINIFQTSKEVGDFFTKVVKDTVSYREKNNVIRKDFLQLLLEIRKSDEDDLTDDGNTLTMNEIISQCIIFFVAGFETSSSTMSFALFELAINPEIQSKLRAEINAVLARNDNKITYDSVNEMKYLEQVIDETLRMHSPARLLQRLCLKDYKIPGENTIIEKGTKVFISVKGMQYDEEYWEDPKTFNPDRFSEEKKKSMNQYTSMPFGQGPRNCIGERFGLMQVKVGLTCLLRKFRVRLNEKTKMPLKNSPSSIVTSAEGGIWLNLEKI